MSTTTTTAPIAYSARALGAAMFVSVRSVRTLADPRLVRGRVRGRDLVFDGRQVRRRVEYIGAHCTSRTPRGENEAVIRADLRLTTNGRQGTVRDTGI